MLHELAPEIVQLNTGCDNSACTHEAGCQEQQSICRLRHIGRYIGKGSPVQGQIIAAILTLNSLSLTTIEQRLHPTFRSNIRKAVAEGYYCHPFCYSQHIPDIHNINVSLPERTGKPMSSQYLQTVEELGGAPTELRPYTRPACPIHYDIWWGVFRREAGYLQGDILTNERLVGYVLLRRNGDYAFYSKILGHGDYLRFGIMHLLHREIVSWALHGATPEAQGLHHLIYAGYYQGLEGLQVWKRRAMFRPAYLTVALEDT